MIKTFSIGLSLIIILLGLAAVAAAQDNSTTLSASIKIPNGTVLTKEAAPIIFVFRNSGRETVRILNVFDDSHDKTIFFIPKLTDNDGTPIQLIGGGKVSLSRDSIKYKELKTGEEYEIQLDLKNFVPEGSSLKEGNYNLVFDYYNQYGDDCFRGKLESNSINLTIN